MHRAAVTNCNGTTGGGSVPTRRMQRSAGPQFKVQVMHLVHEPSAHPVHRLPGSRMKVAAAHSHACSMRAHFFLGAAFRYSGSDALLSSSSSSSSELGGSMPAVAG